MKIFLEMKWLGHFLGEIFWEILEFFRKIFWEILESSV